MSSKSKRRLRPSGADLMFMTLLNAVAAFICLKVFFRLFDVGHVLPEFAATHAWAHDAGKWDPFVWLIPGAAIGFGLRWFWLVITGRSERGISWGGAAIYGAFLGVADVPLSCFVTGMFHGSALLGLLIGLIMVLLVPSLLMCMVTYGVFTGLVNGSWAQRWINRRWAGKAV